MIKIFKEVFGGILYSVCSHKKEYLEIINGASIILVPLFIFTLIINFTILGIGFSVWSSDFTLYIPFQSETYFCDGTFERLLILLGTVLLINKKLNDR